MYGADITLKHQISEERFRRFLAEAEQQRSVNIAIAGQLRTRRTGISELRAAIAKALLRAGSWLMPEDESEVSNRPVALELRPGQ